MEKSSKDVEAKLKKAQRLKKKLRPRHTSTLKLRKSTNRKVIHYSRREIFQEHSRSMMRPSNGTLPTSFCTRTGQRRTRNSWYLMQPCVIVKKRSKLIPTLSKHTHEV